MKYWMTQSLLSSYAYFSSAEDLFSEKAYQSFLSTLRREEKEPTRAMKAGIQFEADINALVAGGAFESKNEKWDKAVRRFSRICAGGQSQAPASAELTCCGLDLVLYGVCDYIKAGTIYDIKKVTRYEYGKYQNSPQHSMYFHLVPGARRFDYLVFDGSFCYRETYRPHDCRSIDRIICEFFHSLESLGLIEDYKTFWAMNQEREEKAHAL
jgi:hypothetical protein